MNNSRLNRLEDDQRYFPRWEVANKVIYKRDKAVHFHECLSRDISNTGLCLQTYEKLEENQKVFLTVELADGVTIQVHGVVVWKKSDGCHFLVGLQFEDISEKNQDMIFNCAFECERQHFNKKWFEGI